MKDHVVLISKSNVPYKTREKQEYAFAISMTKKGFPAAVTYYSLLKVEYKDIFKNKHIKYFRILNPGLPAHESNKIQEVIDDVYLRNKYPWIQIQDKPFDVAESWVKSQFSANKIIKRDVRSARPSTKALAGIKFVRK